MVGSCFGQGYAAHCRAVRAGSQLVSERREEFRLAPVCFKQLFVCQPQLGFDALDRGDIKRDMPGTVYPPSGSING